MTSHLAEHPTPRLVAADHVGGPSQTESAEGGGRKAGTEPLVADGDHPQIWAVSVRCACCESITSFFSIHARFL